MLTLSNIDLFAGAHSSIHLFGGIYESWETSGEIGQGTSKYLSTRPSAFVIHVEYTFDKSIVLSVVAWSKSSLSKIVRKNHFYQIKEIRILNHFCQFEVDFGTFVRFRFIWWRNICRRSRNAAVTASNNSSCVRLLPVCVWTRKTLVPQHI